jgi:hypothetical protein
MIDYVRFGRAPSSGGGQQSLLVVARSGATKQSKTEDANLDCFAVSQ